MDQILRDYLLRKLCISWHSTQMMDVMLRRSTTLIEMLDATATRCPERVAIRGLRSSCTFLGLQQRSATLALYLHSALKGRGDRIALLIPNEPEFAAAYYGVMRAGAIAVPLSMLARATEVMQLLAHCGASMLILDPAYPESQEIIGQSSRLGIPVLMTGELDPLPATGSGMRTIPQGSEVDFREPIDPERPACILYTSGTTGHPKGAVLTHRGLAANTVGIVERLGLTASDSALTGLPFNYSFGGSILNTHVATGATVVAAPSMVFPARLLNAIAALNPTGFYGVPSTYAILLTRADPSAVDTSSLRYLAQAGGALTPAIQSRVQAAFHDVPMYVMYGQTEACARISILDPEMIERKRGSVGQPLPDVRIEIRDKNRCALPADIVGEVWVRGPNVMQEYWRDPELTAQVLQDGWLQTGDMGRLDSDGYLYIVGRRDDIIKSGAYRILPQEIEEVLMEHDLVEEAAVIGRDDEQLGQAVVALVVLKPGETADAATLQRHCKRRLSGYKVPVNIRFLDALPKTHNGKVQRSALVWQ